MFVNIDSLCCTLKTNTTLYVNSSSIRKEQIGRKGGRRDGGEAREGKRRGKERKKEGKKESHSLW